MKQAVSWDGPWQKRTSRGTQEFYRIIELVEGFSIQQTYLEPGALSAGSKVFLNGTQAGEAEVGKLDRFRVSDCVHPGRNELVIQTDCEPPAEGKLISYDKVSISGIRIDPEVIDNVANTWIVVEVANHTCVEQPVIASIVVSQREVREKVEIADIISPFGGEIEAVIRITDQSMWEPDESGEPQLFDCLIGLQAAGEIMDVAAVRFDVG